MNKNAASLQPQWGGHNPIPRAQSTRSDVPGREILVESLNGRAVGILRWSLRWAGVAFFGVPALIPTAPGGLSGILGNVEAPHLKQNHSWPLLLTQAPSWNVGGPEQ